MFDFAEVVGDQFERCLGSVLQNANGEEAIDVKLWLPECPVPVMLLLCTSYNRVSNLVVPPSLDNPIPQWHWTIKVPFLRPKLETYSNNFGSRAYSANSSSRRISRDGSRKAVHNDGTVWWRHHHR